MQIVYGGSRVGQVNGYSDILFLDMNNRAKGWYSVSGIQLPDYQPKLIGGLVMALTPGNCDMMFVESVRYIHVCKGNYTWTITNIDPVGPYFVNYIPVGANNFFPCAK